MWIDAGPDLCTVEAHIIARSELRRFSPVLASPDCGEKRLVTRRHDRLGTRPVMPQRGH
jgi:hypothetical protein